MRYNFFFLFFFTPFVLQSLATWWFCEAFLNLLYFSIQVRLDARSGLFVELAFAILQENPCRWFPRKIAVSHFCLYSPSTSKMSGVGTLCARVRLPGVDRQSNSSGVWVVLDFNQLKTCFSSCGSVARVSGFGLIFFVL
jgi:hypothetical protein